jgi:hypothetical protein
MEDRAKAGEKSEKGKAKAQGARLEYWNDGML